MQTILEMHQSGFVILMILRLIEGTDYLGALPHTSYKSSTPYVKVLHCADPNFNWRRSVDIVPWSFKSIRFPSRVGTFSKIENKAISIACSNSDASVEIIGRYISFSLLPITALGTKYIMSSCRQSSYATLLVIAAYNSATTVSIKARSKIFGLSFQQASIKIFELLPFETFTYQHDSDLTGTVITSRHPVAVFSGMVNSTFVTAYEQLLPVRLFDKEYVVAVDDNPALYHLQILSEQNGTVITFNNGTSLNVDSNLYQAKLTSRETFYFRSSNPVMVAICRRNGTQSGFVVIPPVSLYSKRVARFTKDSIFMTREETFINSTYTKWTNMSPSGYKTGVQSKGYFSTTTFGISVLYYKNDIMTNGITYGQFNRIENDGIGEDMATEAVSSEDDHHDQSTVVAIGTTLSILILVLVAASLCQKIYV